MSPRARSAVRRSNGFCEGLFVGALFEKSAPTPPQKLSNKLFLYRAFPFFSTEASVPRIGPLTSVENIVASGASHACFRGFLFSPLSPSLHPPLAALGLQAQCGAFCLEVKLCKNKNGGDFPAVWRCYVEICCFLSFRRWAQRARRKMAVTPSMPQSAPALSMAMSTNCIARSGVKC